MTDIALSEDEIEAGAYIETITDGGRLADDTRKAGIVKDIVSETKHTGVNTTIEMTMVVLTDGDDEHRINIDHLTTEDTRVTAVEYRAATSAAPDDQDNDDENGSGPEAVTDGGEDRLELGPNTTTKMCLRCAAHVPKEIPTVHDGPREVQYCPFCGYDMTRERPFDELMQYTGEDAPETDLDELAAAVRDTTAARGVDVYAVKARGLSAADWAEMTDRDRSTVARNVRRATREDS